MLNKYIYLILISVLCAYTGVLKSQIYSPAMGKCSINFPEKYVDTEKVSEDGMNTAFAKAKKDDQVFVFKCVEHRDAIKSKDPKNFLEISALGLAKAMEGTQVKKETFKFKNYDGLETYVTVSSKKVYIFYRVLLVGNIQYQFFVITPSSSKTTEINNFFDSFKLL